MVGRKRRDGMTRGKKKRKRKTCRREDERSVERWKEKTNLDRRK